MEPGLIRPEEIAESGIVVIVGKVLTAVIVGRVGVTAAGAGVTVVKRPLRAFATATAAAAPGEAPTGTAFIGESTGVAS